LLFAVLLAAGTGWLLHHNLAAREAAELPAPPPPGHDRAKDDRPATTFAGRVLSPDGRPVPGARVYLTHHDANPKGGPKARAVTGAAGQFRFTVPAASRASETVPSVFATADGFGPGWAIQPSRTGEVTLRLAKDDVPIIGRILNLEGKPVPGVTVQVTFLRAPPAGLTPWLDAVKKRPNADGLSLDYEFLPGFNAQELNRLFPRMTTGADGRFTLRGVGRERCVALLIEGPTIETKEINVLTRPGLATITVPWYQNAPEIKDLTYYPARFDHAAAPCRVVHGVVRARASGKPVAGATVRTQGSIGVANRYLQARTDQQGRYRLTGLPGKARPGLDALVALPPQGQAHISVRQRIAAGSRIEPARLDFELARGVWIEGQVRNKATGEGIEAQLRYNVFVAGRPQAELRRLYLPEVLNTDSQGHFRFVGLPWRSLLGARAWGAEVGRFRVGMGADRIAGKETLVAMSGWMTTTFRTYPDVVWAVNHDVLAEITPPKGADKVTCDLLLDPGQRQTVRVLDSNGKPLAGVRVAGQFVRSSFEKPLPDAECMVYALEPGQPRTLLFQHDGKHLAGRLVLKGTEKGPVEFKLQASAALSGRLVDAEGRPLRHADITIYHDADGKNVRDVHYPPSVRTDAEGRFRVAGMVPGVRYVGDVQLKGKRFPSDAFDLTLTAGQSRDLGNVKPRARGE
jgi:protocatechuate 3,4-dioxygenase beta subunit